MNEEFKKYSWNREKVIQSIEYFIKIHKRLPVAKEMNWNNKLPTRNTFERKVGMSFYEYGSKVHPELVEINKDNHKQRVIDSIKERNKWSEERVIEAIKDFVIKNHRLPEEQDYSIVEALPSYSVFLRSAKNYYTKHLTKLFEEYISEREEIDQGYIQM